MSQKIKCPECKVEFNMEEGLSSHLKTIENDVREQIQKEQGDKIKESSEKVRLLTSENEEKKLQIQKINLENENKEKAAVKIEIEATKKDSDKDKKAHYICISNVHSCIESFKDKRFQQAHNSSDLALPDGRPIYWALRLLGSKNAEHLPGYYITDKICELANKKKIKIAFYGSTNENLRQLKIN
jgi:UDP-N-acetyl-D-mannosaminuronic acid transferase (WecB/TagA/CpsF family)